MYNRLTVVTLVVSTKLALINYPILPDHQHTGTISLCTLACFLVMFPKAVKQRRMKKIQQHITENSPLLVNTNN